MSEKGTSNAGDRVARVLGLVATLAACISAAVAILALSVSNSAQQATDQLQLNSELDEAWDTLGGSDNTSFISDFSNSQLEKARRLIRDANAIRPNDPRVRLVSAALFVATNDLGNAEEELRKGLRSSPDDYDLRFNLAVVLRLQEKWSEAIEAFTTAKDFAGENDASPQLGLGNLFRAQGRLDQAAEQYQAGIQVSPYDAQIHESLGSVLRQQEKHAEGIAALREAVRLSPDSADFRFKLGNAYMQRKELQNASLQFEEVIRLAPDKYSEAYLTLGLIRISQEDFEQAEFMTKHALRLNPNSAEANNNMGNVFLAKGDTGDAIRFFRTAIEIDANHLRYFNLGNAYSKNGDVDEAIDAYLQSIVLDSEFYRVRINLGRLLAHEGQTELAIEQFRHAVRIDANSAEAHNDLGIVLSVAGSTEEAIASFLVSLEMDPNSAETHLNIGNAFKSRGDLELAHGSFQKALEIDPSLVKARRALGRLLAEGGDLEGAIVELREAVRLEPINAVAHNYLGVVLGMAEQHADAMHEFRTALSIDRDYADARRNLSIALTEMQDG